MMTHPDQKSAFRTRDEQEQAMYPCDGYTRSIIHIDRYREHILEAEARGAAEERAGGARQARNLLSIAETWHVGQIPCQNMSPGGVIISAMEARIAELEGTIVALFDGEATFENWGLKDPAERVVTHDDGAIARGRDPLAVAIQAAQIIRAALKREGGE